MRRLLGVRRRLPDTTLRSALCTVEPDRLRQPPHALVKKAQRRKALESAELPFGVVSLDGKAFSIPGCDDWVAQRQTQGESGVLVGIVRTVKATLTSCDARPIIDITPIPAPTNEMGIFEHALESLCAAYKGSELFQLVTYDAGACSAHNARAATLSAGPWSSAGSFDGTGESRRPTKFSTQLSPKTLTLGSKAIHAQPSSSRCCAASPTPCSRSFVASPNAPTSDELRLGKS